MTNLIIFGDSIARGGWDLEKGGWVSRLRKKFEKQNPLQLIYNSGVSAESTRELLKRLNIEYEARKSDSRPNIVLFAIGINDSRYYDKKENSYVKLDEFKQNIRKLYFLVKDKADKVVFIGLNKVNESKTMPDIWDEHEFFDNEQIALYDQEIERFCKEENTSFIPINDLLKKEDVSPTDGLHPNAKGHEKIYQKVKKFLLEERLIE